MTNPQSERWASVPNSNGYEVSDMGRVRRDGSVLKDYTKTTGYREIYIGLPGGGRRRTTIHALVLETFVGSRPKGCDCLHGNGDRADNRLTNLKWGTRRENMADQYRHGTRVMGSAHPQAKLSYDIADEIRRRYANGETQRGLAREFQVDWTVVHDLIHQRLWVRPKSPPTASHSAQTDNSAPPGI